MDLLLHVGLHKTGTSTVQNFLYNHRDELLKYKIYYPDVAIHGTQHALIPANMLPDGFGKHLVLENLPKHQLNLDYHLDLLMKGLDEHKPLLTIMSSEVWSEVWPCFDRLMSKIKPLFNKVTIFVSKRNLYELSLSALKHSIRHCPYYLDKRQNIVTERYFEKLNDTKFIYNFWKKYEIPLVVKSIEDAAGNLTDYYFGDIIDEYNKDARLLLQNYKEEISNIDPYKAYDYLLPFLCNNSQMSAEIVAKNIIFYQEDIKQVTNEQLIIYLKYFEKDLYKGSNLTWEDQINALKFAKIIK